MKKNYIIYVMLGWSNLLISQPTTFSKLISNFPQNPENGWVIKEVEDGYLLMSPTNCLDNSNLTCCAVSKLNSMGDIVWYHIYPFRPTVSNMVVHQGKVYISGHTFGTGSQYVLYCLDSLGNLVWEKQYGSPTVEDEFPRLALWGNKLILCGAQDRNLNNRRAPIMYSIVVDLDGNQLMDLYYGESNESTLSQKLIIDDEGDCVISFLYCPDICVLDLKSGVISYDTLGDIKMELDFPSSLSSWSCIPAQINEEIFAIKWYVDNTSMPLYDDTPPAIFFTDAVGNIQDTLLFPNQTKKEIRNMEAIWDKGIIACGFEYQNYLTPADRLQVSWLCRIDENKEISWERTYLDSAHQGESFGFQDVIPTRDGGYIATGTINNKMTGVLESHIWLLKLDSLGCVSSECDSFNTVSNTQEATLLKGVNIFVYPNPASDHVQIELPLEFDLKKETYGIMLSNTGHVVSQKKINSHRDQLNLFGVPSGLYYLVICSGHEILGRKRIVISK